MKCHTGYYLAGSICSEVCPPGFTTDTLRGKCVEDVLIERKSEIIYSKPYTVGSCRNTCGYQMIDCSCDPGCRQNGTCCYDYDKSNCESLMNASPSNCTNATNGACELCENESVCTQCSPGYFLHNSQCLTQCPSNLFSNENGVCVEKKTEVCNVENCDECENDGNCRTCQRGTFLYEGQCTDRCPNDYRADRMTWSCLEAPVFAWYWVYPSRTSCNTHCGVVVDSSWDCSCSDTCFYYGNCCQDIEDYCPQFLFWRKKNFRRKAKKNLKKGVATKPAKASKEPAKAKNEAAKKAKKN